MLQLYCSKRMNPAKSMEQNIVLGIARILMFSPYDILLFSAPLLSSCLNQLQAVICLWSVMNPLVPANLE